MRPPMTAAAAVPANKIYIVFLGGSFPFGGGSADRRRTINKHTHVTPMANTQLNEAVIAAANMSGANFQGAQLQGAKVTATNLDSGDFTGADLTDSKWFGVNVSQADFTDAKTTGIKSGAVDWSGAKVPPTEIPESFSPPPWLPVLFAGFVLLIVAAILAKIRRQPEEESG